MIDLNEESIQIVIQKKEIKILESKSKIKNQKIKNQKIKKSKNQNNRKIKKRNPHVLPPAPENVFHYFHLSKQGKQKQNKIVIFARLFQPLTR